MKSKDVYHLRAEPGQRPPDVVSDLAHAVLHGLLDMRELRALDPHRWPALYLIFRDVFKNRVVRCRGFGEREEHRKVLKTVLDGPHLPPGKEGKITPVYALESGREQGALAKLLGWLAHRRLRAVLKGDGGAFRSRASEVLSRVLVGRLSPSADCPGCSARRSFREK